jgi:hypothetical protein
MRSWRWYFLRLGIRRQKDPIEDGNDGFQILQTGHFEK